MESYISQYIRACSICNVLDRRRGDRQEINKREVSTFRTSDVHGVALELHWEVSLPLAEVHEVPRGLGPGGYGCVLGVVREHFSADAACEEVKVTTSNMKVWVDKVEMRGSDLEAAVVA